MRQIVSLLAFVPAIAMAAEKINLPLNQLQGELCYIRVYSAEHLKRNPKQKIKAAAVTISHFTGENYSFATNVITLDGREWINGGGFQATKATTQVQGGLDGTGSRVLIKQNQANANQILLKAVDHLVLVDLNDNQSDNPPEEMIINRRSTDAVWLLERVSANGSANPSCYEILKNRL